MVTGTGTGALTGTLIGDVTGVLVSLILARENITVVDFHFVPVIDVPEYGIAVRTYVLDILLVSTNILPHVDCGHNR